MLGEYILPRTSPESGGNTADVLQATPTRNLVMPLILGFFSPGPLEIFIIAGIILLLFGNRLPSVMRSMGRGIVEFKKGVQGIEDDVEQASKIEDSGNKAKDPAGNK